VSDAENDYNGYHQKHNERDPNDVFIRIVLGDHFSDENTFETLVHETGQYHHALGGELFVFGGKVELVAFLVAEDDSAACKHYQDVHLDHGFTLDEDEGHEAELLDDHEHQDGPHDLLLGGLLQVKQVLNQHLNQEANYAHHRQRPELQVFVVLLGLLLEEPLEVAFKHDADPRQDLDHQDLVEVGV